MLAATSSTSIPWAALLPLMIVQLGLLAYCLTDMVRHPETRHIPRWGWALICLFVNPVGAIVYLVAGRSEKR